MQEVGGARAAVSAHIQAHRLEVEQTIIARVMELSADDAARGGKLTPRLARAVSAGVSHSLTGIEHGEDRAGPIPEALLVQTRRLALRGVELDVVIRGYFAGYAALSDFILQAAEQRAAAQYRLIRLVLHGQARLFERILAAVAGEYALERRSQPRPPGARELACVRKLLAGEPVDPSDLAYELEGNWHVGAVAQGKGAAMAIRDLATAIDRWPMLVRPERDTIWAWLGGRRRIPLEGIAHSASRNLEADVLVALGEPARGIDGWRLTHQQASAAFRVTRPGVKGVVRYADVSLLASVSQDYVLRTSLQQLYLVPLADARDGGLGLRNTLRAYFGSGRNVSSAASMLGVSRQTVSSRLRAAEEKLGQTLESCGAELEVALRLDNFE